MAAHAAHLEAFAPLEWAIPLLSSPDWTVRKRFRGSPTDPTPDRFPRDTLSSNDGMRLWLELSQRPTAGSNDAIRTVSLCKFGAGLTGFPTICHGGAILTMIDEAFTWAMSANEAATAGKDIDEWNRIRNKVHRHAIDHGLPLENILEGSFVTAHLDVKLLKPVLCPGLVGIEVTMREKQNSRLKMRAVMKDGSGVTLAQADSIWIKIGGPKL